MTHARSARPDRTRVELPWSSWTISRTSLREPAPPGDADSWPDRAKHRDSIFRRVAASIEVAANDAGYSVILCNTGWSLSREVHYLNHLLARRVDGLLCIESGDERRAHRAGAAPSHAGRRLRAHRCYPWGVEVDAVEIDNVQGAFDATAHLLDLGHRRVGCITGLPNSNLNEERIAVTGERW